MLQREITLTMWFNVIYVTFIRKQVLKETLQLQSLGLIRLYCDYTVSNECTSFRIFQCLCSFNVISVYAVNIFCTKHIQSECVFKQGFLTERDKLYV